MRAVLRLSAGLCLAGILAPAALADERSSIEYALGHTDWAAHPGAALAAMVAMVLGGLLAAAGLGATVALLGVVAPRARDFVDRTARPASPGRLWLVGSLALGGVLFALIGASRVSPGVATGVGIALGLPALAIFAWGALGAIPLLGERLLGDAGTAASPLRRSVAATLTMAVAFVPAIALGVTLLGLLVGLVALAWPLGAGIEATRALFARRS